MFNNRFLLAIRMFYITKIFNLCTSDAIEQLNRFDRLKYRYFIKIIKRLSYSWRGGAQKQQVSDRRSHDGCQSNLGIRVRVLVRRGDCNHGTRHIPGG